MDLSETFLVGNVDEKARNLVAATQQALEIGISCVKPGTSFNKIGQLISEFASSKGFSVISDFSGHGIGRLFHMPPVILHTSKPELLPHFHRE